MTRTFLAITFIVLIGSCTSNTTPKNKTDQPVEKAENQKALVPLEAPVIAVSNADKALEFIKVMEGKDENAIEALLTENFIQHDPALKDGVDGLKNFISSDQNNDYSVDVFRMGHNENFAFTHGLYNNRGPKVGIELFRFENGKIAEHWAVFSSKISNNLSGNSQIDGVQTSAIESKSKWHWKMAYKFVNRAYIRGEFDIIENYTNSDFREHASFLIDGREMIEKGQGIRSKSNINLAHVELVEVYGTDGFCLAVSKGILNKKDVVIFDLFAFEHEKISEHWEVIDEVPVEGKSMNPNGIL